jgi:endoglycosylceramidase
MNATALIPRRSLAVLALVSAVGALAATSAVTARPDGATRARSTAAPGSPRVEGAASDTRRFITDDAGRVLILRGTNIPAKTTPALLPEIEAEDARIIAEDLGFNVVRYSVLWEAIEPTEGTYDEAYLDATEQRLDWFADAGVHVVLDLHQDCPPSTSLRPKPNGAEANGHPAWAIERGMEGIPYTATGDNFTDCTSPAVQRYLKSFYDPTAGHPDIQDAYIDMVEHLVRRLGSHPAVLGLDIMNEPIPPLEDVLALSPNPQLTRFTQRAIDRIRTVNQDLWIMAEPTALRVNNAFPSDLGPISDPRPGTPRLVLAPHVYETSIFTGPKADAAAKRDFARRWWDLRDTEPFNRDLPLWLGEWGEWPPYAGYVMYQFDRQLVGGAHWAYSRFWVEQGPDGADPLIRPYPQATAGTPLVISWKPGLGPFLYRYTSDADIDAPTEIVLPDTAFPNGFDLTVDRQPIDLADPPPGVSWNDQRNVLSINETDDAEHVVVATPRG